MQEPGLDKHDWETEWSALEPLVADSPLEALPEVHALVRRMLEESGYPLGDAVAREGTDPEILKAFAASSEITQRVESGEDIGPGDIGEALRGYRSLYQSLLEERGAP